MIGCWVFLPRTCGGYLTRPSWGCQSDPHVAASGGREPRVPRPVGPIYTPARASRARPLAARPDVRVDSSAPSPEHPMPDPKKPRFRSAEWFGRTDRDGFIYRSWVKNRGVPHDQFDGRPVIGICNTFSELTPCNSHFRTLAEHVKQRSE